MIPPIEILYKINFASTIEITRHLIACDSHFIPQLSERVIISEYAQKLINNATNFEAWVNQQLIGLVSAYFNSSEGKSGYITNVSVERAFLGCGIASSLLNSCITSAKEHNLHTLNLDVSSENQTAIQLYKKYGFKEYLQKGEFLKMHLQWLN